jgi:hypothetical protein
MPALPTFATQPDEDSVLRPAIVEWLRAEGFEVYLDGLFDLVVAGTEDQRDKHLELKVRLSSQNTQCPLTLPQWRVLNGLTSTSALNRSALVVIYDSVASRYALLRPARLRSGAQSTESPKPA